MSYDLAPPESDPTPDAPDIALGNRLREARKTRKMSLKDVADQAGVSLSMLSQIERGISSPSIRMLRNICHTLGIDGAELFTPARSEPGAPQEVGAEFVVRTATQHPMTVGGITKFRLTPAACSHLEGFLIDIGPDAVTDPNFLLQTGDKIGYVVRGRLRLFIDDVVLELEAGDAYGFASGRRYRWENGWDAKSTILVINSKHFYV